MDHFHHRDGELYAEDVPLARIAEDVGTPVYVYSRATLERHARVFREGLAGAGPAHFAFAVKSNPNLAVLRVMQREGFGADVVSGGELARALAAGMAAEDIVFSGVGKTARELAQGLDTGIGQFNLESEEEGAEISAIAAARGLRAPCALRVNPDIDAGTHDKISTGKADNKFGVPIGRALEIYTRLAAMPDWDAGPEPDLSVVAFRYRADSAFNDRLLARIQQEGRVFMSGTRIAGETWLRCAILSFRTHLAHIDETIDALARTAAALQSE